VADVAQSRYSDVVGFAEELLAGIFEQHWYAVEAEIGARLSDFGSCSIEAGGHYAVEP
jgi:hypothetical protein